MPRRRSHDSLMPPGLSIEHVEIGSTEIVAVARSRARRLVSGLRSRVDANSQPVSALCF